MKAARKTQSIRGAADLVLIVEIVLTFVLLGAALWALLSNPAPPNFSPDLAKMILTAIIGYWLSKGVQKAKANAQARSS